MKIYLLHTTNTKTGADLWIAFDEARAVRRGKRRTVLDAWQREHGKITAIARYRGIMRPSEAAMTIADVQTAPELAHASATVYGAEERKSK